MADIRDNYSADKSFHYNTLAPYLMNNASLAQIAASIEHSPGSPSVVYEFPEIKISNAHDHSDLLSRKDFQGLLVTKIDLQLDIFRTIRSQQLDKQLEQITALLKDELVD